MSTLATKLKKLKGFDLARFEPTLWIIKRDYDAFQRVATYDPLFVNTQDKLRKKLRDIARRLIGAANHVQPYEYLNADQDEDTVLAVKANDTDFKSIAAKIRQGSDGPMVTEITQMFGAWAYVIHLTDGKSEIFAVRKITEGWKLKQAERYLRVVFRNHMLIDLEDKAVFQIDSLLDFFSFEDELFILNKKRFESVLNFRVGMEESRDVVLNELSELNIVNDPEVLRSAISDKLTLLRRIAMIKKNGYYKQADFLKKCKAVCKKRGWPVKFEGNRMIANRDNVEVILRLLNQDRLTSLITDEDFDVDVKHKVPSE